MKSTKWSLNINDFLKGLVMAILVPALVVAQQSISAGSLTFNWQSIAMAAIGGFIGYLLKNFATDTNKEAVQTLSKQNVTIIENPK